MKYLIILAVLASYNVLAYNPMGGYFFDAKTKDRIVLTCSDGEVAENCEEAYLTLIKNNIPEVLHHMQVIPMDDSNTSHYERYHKFYVLRDTLIMNRQLGAQPWVIWNALQINKAFSKATKVMFSKKTEDFERGVKLSHGNFKKLIEVIGQVL